MSRLNQVIITIVGLCGSIVLMKGYFSPQIPWTVKNHPPKGKRILLFGDEWLRFAVDSKKFDVIADSRESATIFEALQRIDKVLRQYPSDLVVVSLGTYDLSQGVPWLDIYKNIEALITKIQADGRIVVLVHFDTPLAGDNYIMQLRSIAKNQGVLLVESNFHDKWSGSIKETLEGLDSKFLYQNRHNLTQMIRLLYDRSSVF